MANGNQHLRYVAAGGVVAKDEHALTLERPSRGEVRLPKGHVDPGESPEEAAVREVLEESGYAAHVTADLGTLDVEYDHDGKHWVRTERYFLMALDDPSALPSRGESQFVSAWRTWPEAIGSLTFDREREWVERAREIIERDGELAG